MKRTVLFTVFIFSLFLPFLAGAQETEPCREVETIAMLAGAESSPRTIRRALTNYNESRLGEGNYCLVFNISGGAVPVESDSQIFSLNVESFLQEHGNHDIYITGLKLSAEPAITLPLLTITNNTTSRVIVTGLQMTNVKNGLKLQGSGPIEVRGGAITGAGGDPATRTGAGVDVLSDNARVQSSQVSNCAEGIKIAASNVFLGAENPSAYETDKNTFTGNAIGIHQTSGSGNKWPFNSVSGGNGIVVDGGARPVMRLAEGNLASLECTQPEGATAVAACEIQFDSLPESGGEVEVYKTEQNLLVDSQGKDYIARCRVGESNKCIFDAADAATLISQIMCGEDMKCDFTALQTSEASSMYANPFKIEERRSTILMPTGEEPLSIPSGMTGGGEAGHELYVEGGESSGDSGKLERSGGGPGGGDVRNACAFTTPNGMEFRGAVEMWWWLVFILPATFVLRRRR